jgi:hypothetical protein
MDQWFYQNFSHTRAYQVWKAGLDYLVNNIDAKYFNNEMGRPVGFVGFISPFYELGPAAYQSTGINDHFKF